jgi:PAS domain-containing protein
MNVTMIDKSKTKQELIKELASLRQRIMELEKSDSERKRTEGALQESEERFRKLADSTWEGIFIHKEGMILDVNKPVQADFQAYSCRGRPPCS